MPTLERDGLDLAEAERQLDRIEAHRKVNSAPLGERRFIAHELAIRPDRALRPCNNDAFGRTEVRFDVPAPICAATDMRIPPDAEPFSLESFDERVQSRSIFGLVGDENVRSLIGHSSL